MIKAVNDSVVTSSYDIAIVGGGMVGTALACAIASTDAGSQVRIVIVDAQQESYDIHQPKFQGCSFDPRVSAISMASQSFLTNIGAWPEDYGLRTAQYRDMRVWDAEGTGEIAFSAREVGQSYLGQIVENSITMACLREVMGQHDNITFMSSVKVVDVKVADSTVQKNEAHNSIFLDTGEKISAELIVAADGALSFVRGLMNFDMREWEYGHSAIVTTIRTEKSHEYTAWQRFLPEGPLAFLPVSNGNDDPHYCSIVWSAVTQYADNLMAMSDSEFTLALGRAFEYRLGNVEVVGSKFSFPLKQRHAKNYYKNGVVLVGDAAHTIHPLAGQGVNLGFGDVAVLAKEIDRAAQRGIAFSDNTIVSRYQRERKVKNLATMGAMEGFKRLFAETALPIRLLRNEGMKKVNAFGPLKRKLIQQAMGV